MMWVRHYRVCWVLIRGARRTRFPRLLSFGGSGDFQAIAWDSGRTRSDVRSSDFALNPGRSVRREFRSLDLSQELVTCAPDPILERAQPEAACTADVILSAGHSDRRTALSYGSITTLQ